MTELSLNEDQNRRLRQVEQLRERGPKLGKPSRERTFRACHLKTAAPATLTSVKDVGIFSFKEILRSEVLPRHQCGFFRMKNLKLYSFVGFLICKYVNII